MRHANSGRKFDRNTSNRAAMFGNLVANLFAHERIETTVPRAKEIRRIAEHFITRAARFAAPAGEDTRDPARIISAVAVKRHMRSQIPRWRERLVDGEVERIDVVEHLFREIAPRFVGRPGGYTRILRTRNRRGDNAEMAFLELVVRNEAVGRKAEKATEPVVRQEAPKSRSAEE
ncbi:MAG: 50S ribosomal protein L17 [Deltaproteobacteria bacterium]|nr:50S ribosomal protein L17 [Deltaproteobacteria bacterium]